ncbi:MAG: S-adenosylmethionine decarboxylase [Candidatus Omnitrophica bacterium]|nr:S-adenosylmethionine decarboxylase [Candidatus Omnitrophota bacterium]
MTLDMYECDPASIRSARKLREFVDQMCRILDMKKYGKTHTPYFGLSEPHTAGYSLLQFIETSSITGHFSELTNAAYLNVFSCKKFDVKLAARFAQMFFGAKRMRKRVHQRI